MNDYLAVIYRKDLQALSNLLQTRSCHVQSHLDEALKVVLTDDNLEPHVKHHVSQMLLCTGASCDVWTCDHEPVLCWATRFSQAALVELFLNFGSQVNAQDGDGYTALHHAVYRSDVKLTGLLLSAGADPNIEDANGFIPLVSALHQPNWGVMDLLLIDTDVNHTNFEMKTALHIAAYYQKFPLTRQLVSRLLDQGADVNAQTSAGYTPLLQSIGAENVDVDFVQSLIDGGADVNLTDHQKNSCLHVVAASHAESGPALTRILINSRANVNAKNSHNLSPLCEALCASNTTVVRILVQSNCDVNVTCDSERRAMTALSFAVMLDDFESIEILLAAGCECRRSLIESAVASLALSVLGIGITSSEEEMKLKERMGIIKELGLKPQTLKQLCRSSIRRHLPAGRLFQVSIDNLILPSKLKEYIELRNFLS